MLTSTKSHFSSDQVILLVEHDAQGWCYSKLMLQCIGDNRYDRLVVS